MSAATKAASTRWPVSTLTLAFVAWKCFLGAIAAGATLVGDAYDTSGGSALGTSCGSRWGSGLLARFTSWDAIYFVNVARRGYLYEQEWAFGSGMAGGMTRLAQGLRLVGLANGASNESASACLLLESLAGIIIANASHYLSVLVLYRLSWHLWRDDKLALVAAILHLVSPAGLFLSAPYGESGFALLSFVGYYLLARSHAGSATAPTSKVQTGLLLPQPLSLKRAATVVAAGLAFGLASTFRSNGILNGIPFAWEFLLTALHVLPRRPQEAVQQLAVLGLGGICVAAGSVVPQAVAYWRFCYSAKSGPRPWCQRWPPSVYAFVQSHYWGVGFLNYWTLSNLPLFVLAAPMLFVLLRSGFEYLRLDRRGSSQELLNGLGARSAQLVTLVRCMAVAQVLLTVLAFTSYHVQIITRISSGYPVWYWWLAANLMDRKSKDPGNGIVMFMVMYASVQGALFASFLPPA